MYLLEVYLFLRGIDGSPSCVYGGDWSGVVGWWDSKWWGLGLGLELELGHRAELRKSGIALWS